MAKHNVDALGGKYTAPKYGQGGDKGCLDSSQPDEREGRDSNLEVEFLLPLADLLFSGWIRVYLSLHGINRGFRTLRWRGSFNGFLTGFGGNGPYVVISSLIMGEVWFPFPFLLYFFMEFQEWELLFTDLPRMVCSVFLFVFFFFTCTYIGDIDGIYISISKSSVDLRGQFFFFSCSYREKVSWCCHIPKHLSSVGGKMSDVYLQVEAFIMISYIRMLAIGDYDQRLDLYRMTYSLPEETSYFLFSLLRRTLMQ